MLSWNQVRTLSFNKTPDQGTDSIEVLAEKGTPYNFDPELAKYSQKREFTESIIIENWELPMGAFGESNGPS